MFEGDPLVFAASRGAEQKVQKMMAPENCIEPHRSCRALVAAARNGHMKTVETLLVTGVDVTSEAAAEALASVMGQDQWAVVLKFLESGFPAASQLGGEVFEAAAFANHIGIVRELLARKASAASETGSKALQLAAQEGHVMMMEALLGAGAEASSPAAGGLALREAAIAGNGSVVDLLLSHGASAATPAGAEALECAASRGHAGIARRLLGARADPSNGLVSAASRGATELVVDLSWDADAYSIARALKEAARFGHLGVARCLLDQRADPSTTTGADAVRLALACKYPGGLEIAELLLERADRAAAKATAKRPMSGSDSRCGSMSSPDLRRVGSLGQAGSRMLGRSPSAAAFGRRAAAGGREPVGKRSWHQPISHTKFPVNE